MSTAATEPRFSVIIATRDRPALLQRAIASVLAQRGCSFELIVVDDGSASAPVLPAMPADASGLVNIRLISLRRRSVGHGPSFARNEGLALAAGAFVCFLDDDDHWTDPGHLHTCDQALALHQDGVDAYFSHQVAVHADGRQHTGPLWLGALVSTLATEGASGACHRVDAEQLLQLDGFAHLNCSIYRRSLLREIGGFDEALRYEEDLDLYLRVLDEGGPLLVRPAVIGQHHIPDPQTGQSASTRLPELDRHLMRMRWCDRLLATARQPGVQRRARLTKAYALKHRAQALRQAGDPRSAHRAMREALACDFSFKWLFYTLWEGGRCWASRQPG